MGWTILLPSGLGHSADRWPEPEIRCIGLGHSGDWWPEPVAQYTGLGHSALVKARNYKVVFSIV